MRGWGFIMTARFQRLYSWMYHRTSILSSFHPWTPQKTIVYCALFWMKILMYSKGLSALRAPLWLRKTIQCSRRLQDRPELDLGKVVDYVFQHFENPNTSIRLADCNFAVDRPGVAVISFSSCQGTMMRARRSAQNKQCRSLNFNNENFEFEHARVKCDRELR